VTRNRRWLDALLEQGGVLLVMTILSVIHTWPLALFWRTHLAGGRNEDPWMNAWHIDWVRRAVLESKNPFFADVLHYPLGAELYWHTLVPAKSIWGLLLVPALGSVASYNLIIFATFILTGMTAYWLFSDRLAHAGVTDIARIGGAFVGACVLDFSRYHLAHSFAHMDLSSLEGLPLYLLFFFRYLEAPRRSSLIGAALSIGYVAFCNFYYIYYLALFSLLWVAFRAWKRGPLLSFASLRSDDVRRAGRVGAAALVACLPAVMPLLLHLHPAPIGTHHGDSDYPADPLLLVLPDALSVWQHFLPTSVLIAVRKLQGGILNDVEGGVFLGVAAPILAFIGWRTRTEDTRNLFWIGVCFAVLSFGTHLHIGGQSQFPAQIFLLAGTALAFTNKRFRAKPYARDVLVLLVVACAVSLVVPITAWGERATAEIPMPYLFFKHMVPLFGRGGMPVRFLLLTQICLAALASIGAAKLIERVRADPTGKAAIAAGLLTALTTYECKSVTFPLSEIKPLPAAFDVIRDDPERSAVLTDHVIGQWEETLHHRPISFARQSRTPVRELEFLEAPLFRAIVNLYDLDKEWSEGDVHELRAKLRASHYRFYVGHTEAVAPIARQRKTTVDVLAQRRAQFVEGVLGGTLLYRDADREIYQFW
jgi:hypothetical protein